MSYFYITYDMTPHDEEGLDYIHLGIGNINPNNMIGECQYNRTSTCYSPQPGDQSVNDTSGRVIPTPSVDNEPV